MVQELSFVYDSHISVFGQLSPSLNLTSFYLAVVPTFSLYLAVVSVAMVNS